MEIVNRLLYSMVFVFALTISANAKYNMLSSEKQAYMYDEESGTLFLQVTDAKGNPVMMHILFANGSDRFFNAKGLINNLLEGKSTPARHKTQSE